MSPSRTPACQRLLSFPLPRPVYHLSRFTQLRPFTHNTHLLLVSPTSLRPQLPFLHSSASSRTPSRLSRNSFQSQLSRLITTEQKNYVKEQLWGAARITAYLWTGTALVAVLIFGIENEHLERKYPSPREWSWASRWQYRSTRGQEQVEANESGLVDYAAVGDNYRKLIARLEDPSIDGWQLHPQLGAEGDIYVEGIGRTGLDITARSEPWRRGYYQCLMGAARAAEHLDTWVRDKTRNIAFPPEVVIGPSNPRPRPVPYGAKKAPLEEDCEPAFEAPEVYYMKILTTHGFSTRQRLDASLAYADWLDFKGLHSSAEDMYDWGLDIATGALPLGVNDVVDTKTGVINEYATYVTPNILLATTSLAIHHAQNKHLSTALPIFLSILRAYRCLPNSPALPSTTPPEQSSEISTLDNIIDLVRAVLIPPAYPPVPPSGNDPATRTPTTTCEEAATMSHIGEILFASPSPHDPISSRTTKTQSSGLSWTRSAVNLAEETLLALPSSLPGVTEKGDAAEARVRCSECLLVAMENWEKMVAKLRGTEDADRDTRMGKTVTQKGWFWGPGLGTKGTKGGEQDWEEEAKVVEAKAREVRRIIREEGVLAA